MIGYIRGTVLLADAKKFIINVNGVGYEVQPTKSVLAGSIKVGDELEVHTYLNVKEDRLELYGFKDESEKALFMQLISITGIGPKLALAIISHLGPDQLRQAIMEGSDHLIMTVPGVGGKNAKRIILELKGKLVIDQVGTEGSVLSGGSTQDEVIEALLALGFNNKESSRALAKLQITASDSTSSILKQALQILKSNSK